MALTRDLGHLALALCLGIPLIILVILIGSMLLLPTSDEPQLGEHEPTGSFVCISDVAGTLLLCEQNYGAQPTTYALP